MRRPTAAELRKLKDDAAEAATRGKLEKAADLYRRAAQGDPGDVGARHKLAEVLRRAGRTGEAIRAYREVADRFGKDGLLIKAIAISKAILDLDPEHVETQAALAALYARRAATEGSRLPPGTVGATRAPAAALTSPAAPPPVAADEERVAIPLAPRGGPQAGAAGAAAPEVEIDVAPADEAAALEVPRAAAPARGTSPEHATGFARIVHAAGAAIGIDDDDVVSADAEARSAALPRVPIFSDLSPDAFVELARATVLHRVPEGESPVREGDGGTSFYVVASGTFAVSRRDEAGGSVVLARLGEGEFFGEMALLSGAARSATVTAEADGEVLELRADVLLGIARRHPDLARSLRRFYRQRILANAMALSPIFRPFRRGERKLLVERFRSRPVRAGEVVIREATPSDGLYVVLEGALDVVKRNVGRDLVIGRLGPGDLFGEMSCLRKVPASASVVVRRAGTLLRLPREDFDEMVVTHPQILELVSTLSDERAGNLDAILSGHARWTDEGLVLT